MPAVEFTYPVNWAEEYLTDFEYRTAMFVSRKGSEQRRATRQKPREGVSFTASVWASQYQSLVALTRQNYQEQFLVPNWVRSQTVSGIVSLGEDTLPVAVVPAWAVAGRTVAVFNGSATEFAEIDSVTSTEIVLTDGLSQSLGLTAKVAPARYARLSAVANRRRTDRVAEFRFTFEIDPTSGLLTEASDPDTSFRGFEVLSVRPNWAEPLSEEFLREFETIDNNVGPVGYTTPWAEPRSVVKFSYLGVGRESIHQIVQFFHRHKGQRSSFYCPTWSSDLTLVTPAATGENSLLVEGTQIQELFASSRIYRNVALTRPGVVFPAGIVSMADSGNNTLLTLDADIPASVNGVSAASWLVMSRFASDQLSLRYKTDAVADIAVGVQSLEDDFGALTINGMPILIDGDYVLIARLAGLTAQEFN